MEAELCAGSSPVALGDWHLHQQEPAVGLHGCCDHVDFSASSIEGICSEGRFLNRPVTGHPGKGTGLVPCQPWERSKVIKSSDNVASGPPHEAAASTLFMYCCSRTLHSLFTACYNWMILPVSLFTVGHRHSSAFIQAHHCGCNEPELCLDFLFGKTQNMILSL